MGKYLRKFNLNSCEVVHQVIIHRVLKNSLQFNQSEMIYLNNKQEHLWSIMLLFVFNCGNLPIICHKWNPFTKIIIRRIFTVYRMVPYLCLGVVYLLLYLVTFCNGKILLVWINIQVELKRKLNEWFTTFEINVWI